MDEVEYIANDVLSYCSNLKGLSLTRVESIGSHKFCDNESLEYISLNSEYLEEVNTIANDNISLTTINLGTRVSSIINSFNGCAAITEVYCKATTPPALTDSFDSVVAPTIYVPADSVNVYKSADGWKEFAIVGYDFENGEIVQMLPNNEIWYTNGSTTEATTPYNTNVFGANIVSNTYDAAKECWVIKFDGEVTTIGAYAFLNCSSFESVTIGDSVTTIGDYAFENCSSLESVTIPDSVTTIGVWAFAHCSNLTSVTIPDSVTTIGKGAFYCCDSLTSVTIPDRVTTIGKETFYGCSSLTSITIPDSVTEIGYSAFEECGSLTSVTIPDSVTTIGRSAFAYCRSLTSVYCKAITPPAGDDNMFEFNAEGRKIYVPMESVNKYKSASGWSDYADAIEGYNF